jgi:Cu2+-exporting ATPase
MDVLGEARRFCCPGCQAVCKAIVDAGLADYYRYRTDRAVSARHRIIPEFLQQVELYDRPEIQHGFVTAEQDWREAALLLENIRCPACLWLNERQLRSLDGVIDVHIDDVTQRARVRWDPGRIRLSDILRAIAGIGYIAHPYDASRSEQLNALRRRRSTERLIFAGATGMIVMHFSLATWFMGGPGADGQLALWEVVGRWTSLLVAGLILAYPGQEFFAGAWNDLKNRRLGMDIPVVLGLSGAFLGSLFATLTGRGDVYFESIAMFVFFLLLARRYELRGKLRAADRLERLARLTPRTAHRLDAAGQGVEVPVGELVPGDCVRLLPGETLAVDGVVLRGSSSFDESLLTGEASPVLRQHGDAVVAGSVNGEQPVVVRVTHGIQASAISEIRQLVERGLERRPRVALLAERAAGWFVAVLLVIATATAVYWWQLEPAFWLSSTIAVLIVTCPCALALATPVALAVSAGRFIELGVLPLRMRALDALAGSDLFVFDKTGTLTAGQPVLVSLVATGKLDENTCLRYAAALSCDSEHPLARSLRQRVPLPGIAVERVENIPGAGIRAGVDGDDWRLGNPAFAGDPAGAGRDIDAIVEQARQRGQTVSLLSNSRGVQAVLAFEDPLRPQAEAMLHGLRETGVHQLAILSGDTGASVAKLGDRLGIADCLGGMSPQDKLTWTRSRQQQGHEVAMFGDGINDAPALAAADVSISFSDATDLANSSSDFLVLGNDINVLVDARRLARSTRLNIRQNLAWAAGYNLLAVPFAAMGWIPPWGAAIGMSLSSLLVMMNALRLQRAG